MLQAGTGTGTGMASQAFNVAWSVFADDDEIFAEELRIPLADCEKQSEDCERRNSRKLRRRQSHSSRSTESIHSTQPIPIPTPQNESVSCFCGDEQQRKPGFTDESGQISVSNAMSKLTQLSMISDMFTKTDEYDDDEPGDDEKDQQKTDEDEYHELMARLSRRQESDNTWSPKDPTVFEPTVMDRTPAGLSKYGVSTHDPNSNSSYDYRVVSYKPYDPNSNSNSNGNQLDFRCVPDPNSNGNPLGFSLYPDPNSLSIPKSHVDLSRYYMSSNSSGSSTIPSSRSVWDTTTTTTQPPKISKDDIMFSIVRNTLINLTKSGLDSQMTQIFMEFFELFNPIFLEDLEKYMTLSDDIQTGLQSQSWDFTGTEIGGRGFRSPPDKKELVKIFEQIVERNFESE